MKPKYEKFYPDQGSYEIPKFSKNKNQISNQQIRNKIQVKFVKIKKLIIFSPKCPNLGI